MTFKKKLEICVLAKRFYPILKQISKTATMNDAVRLAKSIKGVKND